MDESDRRYRLVALGVLGLLLVTFPLLALFDVDATVFGVPVLWAYLFGAWVCLIGLLALVAGRSR